MTFFSRRWRVEVVVAAVLLVFSLSSLAACASTASPANTAPTEARSTTSRARTSSTTIVDEPLPIGGTTSSTSSASSTSTAPVRSTDTTAAFSTTREITPLTPDVVRRLLHVRMPVGDSRSVDVIACETFDDWAVAIIHAGDPGVALFWWDGTAWTKHSEYSYAVIDGPQVGILPKGLPEALLSWLAAESWNKGWTG